MLEILSILQLVNVDFFCMSEVKIISELPENEFPTNSSTSGDVDVD